ncbi:hypothetical protein [Halioxenophilus sp. WMMB6]|uniref:hypothetical protein n=1 Tax=Halioxenophilus sp. WMMB6 TaxID=3073815 RepID=UPI00295F2AF9|nr:hypothetical protein [Halioxenophilus sp. WMMB6]
MKNYLKELANQGITSADLDKITEAMAGRAEKTGFSHPHSVYHTLAVDLTLGMLDTMQEAEQNLDKTHSLKQWLAIVMDVEL